MTATKKKRANGEGTVFFDQSRDKWVGRAFIDGKRRSVVAATKTDAAARLSKLRREGVQVAGKRLTVTDLLDEWLKRDLAGRGRAPSTVQRHRWAADHLTAQLGDRYVADLSVRDVEVALDRLMAADLGRASLTKILQTLEQALTYAERRDDVQRNVARLAKVPAEAAGPKQRRALSPTEARTLLDALDDEPNGAMFATMLMIGLRPGEAMGLHWRDVDLDAAVVNVTRGQRMEGGRSVIVDELKTTESRRTIQMPTDLVERLREHRKAQAVERMAAAEWIDERIVFSSPTGNVLSPPNVRRQLAAICERVEIEPVIRPNELRHSCASFLSDRGVPNEQIADLLGHTSTRMVDQTYRHRLRPVVAVAADVAWGDEVAE